MPDEEHTEDHLREGTHEWEILHAGSGKPLGIELDEAARQHRAWVAAAAVERWGQDPTSDTLAAARAAVAALAPWLTEEDQ